MHVGLLYRDPAGQTQFLHLAFHHQLIKQRPAAGQGYLWADGGAWISDPESAANAEFLSDYIELASRNTDIAYGVIPPDEAFDEGGRYAALDPSKGLTCATFVALVLKSAGFPVVALETWRAREGDDAWRRSVVGLLKTHDAPEQARLIEGQQAPFRLKPDEIAIAVVQPTIPVTFDEAIALSPALTSQLLSPGAPIDPSTECQSP